MTTLAELLARAKAERGDSLRDMAEQLPVSHSNIGFWLKGATKPQATADNVEALAAYTGEHTATILEALGVIDEGYGDTMRQALPGYVRCGLSGPQQPELHQIAAA